MARKLTDEEREKINVLTGVLLKALPAALRNYGAGIASALVRIPRPQVTNRDLGRICGKYDEAKDELIALVKAEVLDPVEGQEGPQAYTLRTFAPEVEAADAAGEDTPQEVAAEEVATPEPAAEDAPAAEAGAEPVAEAEKSEKPEKAEKPARRTRSRRRSRAALPASASEKAPALNPAPEAAASAPVEVAPAVEEAPAAPAPVPTPAAQEKPADPEPPAEDSAPAPATQAAPKRGRGRLRRRTSGPAQKGDQEKPAPTQGLASVPYVRRGGESEAELREKIVSLDPRLWMNGWLLSHPGAFAMYEKELRGINDAIKDGQIPGDITRRQLAYQMGGDEKFFEFGSDGSKLLRSMGVEDLIRHRPLPKADILYHAPRRRKHMRVLVTENLDPWIDVHDLMYGEGRSVILGERIHAVVLGGGTPVLEHNRLALLLDNLGAEDLEVLYWGDIDRAGLELYCKLKAMLEPRYKILPFTPAYQLMVDRAQDRFDDPLDNETTGQVNIEVADVSAICDGLTPEAAAYATAVIENCRLVPQEILTKKDL